MKATTLEIALNRWPYGLEIQPSPNGLLLRPRRKARATWAKAFRHPLQPADELTSVRQQENKFDKEEWAW